MTGPSRSCVVEERCSAFLKIGVITECFNERGRDASSNARVKMRERVT